MAKKRVSKGERPAKTAIPEPDIKGLIGDTAISAAKSPVLVAQSHGGALLSGGVPGNAGNRGGPGRTPDEIKGTFRQILDEHGIPWVIEMLTGARSTTCPSCGETVEPPVADGVRARLTDTLTRSAVGTQQEVKVEGGMSLVHDTNT